MNRCLMYCFALNSFLFTAFALAQPAGRQGASQREQVLGEFNRKSPQVGEPLPDIQLLDSSGNKFGLSKLRGHYTVLVFGCLT